MTQKELEKAAKEKLKGIVPCEWNQEPFISIFVDAANWRIGSVWHGRDKKTAYGDMIVCIFDRGLTRITLGSLNKDDVIVSYPGYIHIGYKNLVTWAYLIDLIPETRTECLKKAIQS